MRFVLINKKHSEAIDVYDADSKEEAKSYFVGIKQIAEDKFDTLWEVMSSEEHESRQRQDDVSKIYGPGDGEFGSWLDMEKS